MNDELEKLQAQVADLQDKITKLAEELADLETKLCQNNDNGFW